MTTGMVPRPLVPADLPGLLAVQRACYGEGFIESAEVYARRLASAANLSLVLAQGGQVRAYLAAYRSARGKVTPLHGGFDAVPDPDTLYLHDMAVHPACAGQGLAQTLLAALRQAGAGLRYSALVSVQGSGAYWQRQGYAVHELHDPVQCAHLASYGEGAAYMLQSLSK